MGKSVRRPVQIHFGVVLALLGLAVAIFFGISAVTGKSTVKPLVYLIPPHLIGPVFVFFDQDDGMHVMPDPLGNAVAIPPNGVLKLKGTVDDLIGKGGGVRNIYWVTSTKEGKRKILWIVNDPERDDQGNWIYSYFDDAGKPHRATGEKAGGYFDHIPVDKRDDRMVMAHGGCKHQRFVPAGAPDVKIPDCGKFLIISPNGYRNTPDWLWEDTSREYTSISELQAEAVERNRKLLERITSATSSPLGFAN